MLGSIRAFATSDKQFNMVQIVQKDEVLNGLNVLNYLNERGYGES